MNQNEKAETPTQILIGDCRQSLLAMPDDSVHCCVTSPPYFGLRDYGHDGQIGLEQTPEAYVAEMVSVFREVRRVLRRDGTLWLNLGDSYSRSPAKGGSGPGGKNQAYSDTYSAAQVSRVGSSDGAVGRADRPGTRAKMGGLDAKQLLGIPWRVAFALQSDGWFIRQDIIWHKPNPMPESVRDRCTKAHEYIFLLSKSDRYYFDSEAMKEKASRGHAGSQFNTGKTADHLLGRSSDKNRPDNGTRNRRSVWSIPTAPYKGAHFATYPPALITPCILAGCPEGGTVLDPFGGSGTTAQVAIAHKRKAILCELNPAYEPLIRERISKSPFREAKKPNLARRPSSAQFEFSL